MLKDIDSLYAKSSLLFSEQEIFAGLDVMAQKMTAELADKNPILLCVMNGGLVMMGHLVTRLNFHLQIDYVHATRYKGQRRGGEIEWLHKPLTDLQDRTVVIVDDILDEGITLTCIRDEVAAMGAKNIYSAVLINKRRARSNDGVQAADFVALDIDDHFIFGFGLDYQGYLRNLAGIFQVND